MDGSPDTPFVLKQRERLNMMYGENHGRAKRMVRYDFNPTRNAISSGYVFGGKHYIYVFGHQDLLYTK
jgi:hypothetical protein